MTALAAPAFDTVPRLTNLHIHDGEGRAVACDCGNDTFDADLGYIACTWCGYRLTVTSDHRGYYGEPGDTIYAWPRRYADRLCPPCPAKCTLGHTYSRDAAGEVVRTKCARCNGRGSLHPDDPAPFDANYRTEDAR